LINTVKASVIKQEETTKKFIHQLNGLLPNAHSDQYQQINERVIAASKYFQEALKKEMFDPLKDHYDSLKVKTGVKKYMREVHELTSLAKQKRFLLEEMIMLTAGLTKGIKLPKLLAEMAKRKSAQQATAEKEVKETTKKKVKGDSQRLSLAMYQEGKTIEEIAEERSLSPNTVESHLIGFIGDGLTRNQFVSDEKAAQITKIIETIGEEEGTTAIKAKLGDEFSYNEIRAVLNDRKLG